jgi:hypothetical protein
VKSVLNNCFFYLFVLANSVAGFAISAHVKYDSVFVKTSVPAKAKEEAVFNEVNMDFAKKVESKNIGWCDRFWNWILESLFGNSDYESCQNAMEVFFWIIAVVGLAVIIWLLTRTQFTSFLKGNTKNTAFNFSDVEEDISGIDFNDRVNKAFQEQDYRLAIRWLYLKQLYLLNEKNRISYQPFKTNIDYTHELSKSTLLNTFTAISRVYDYVWYGKYSITLSEYQAFEKEFKQFEKNTGV